VRLVVRYLGVILFEGELSPDTEHVLGRGEECEIRLSPDFISRRHGRVRKTEDGRWVYEDLRKRRPSGKAGQLEITDESMVELDNDLDLMTASYLAAHETQDYDVRDLRTMAAQGRRNRKRIRKLAWAVVAVAVVFGAVYIGLVLTRPMNVNELLEYTRPAVVELAQIPRPAVLEDLEELAGLGEDDLLDSAGVCSGFIVAPDVVLTALHCLRSTNGEVTTDFVVTTHDGEHHRPTRALGLDARRDYLFLEVPGLPTTRRLELTEELEIGQPVYTIGNVHGEGIAIREGIAASRTSDRDDPELDYLRFSAAASPGNSGGPLVDGQGRVVGLVFARNASESYNVATASEHLIAGLGRFVENRESQQLDLTIRTADGLSMLAILGSLGLPTPRELR